MAPHLSPTSLTAHASTRSQTSKNVKHVDARGGGRGRDAYRGAGLGGLLPPLHPELPHPPPWAGCGGRRGGTGGTPAPSPALPRGCEGSCGGAGASWIGRGAAGQGPG